MKKGCDTFRIILQHSHVILRGGTQFIAQVYKRVPEILEDGENGLPGSMRQLILRLTDNLKGLDEQVAALEKEIKQLHAGNEPSRKLAEVNGIEPLTASAMVATVGDAKNFDRGSQMAAWIGLVPKQHSSGGKTVLLGITTNLNQPRNTI